MRNEVLAEAEKALVGVLNERPEYVPYQKEIERQLSKALTLEDKMEILKFMMAERLDALSNAMFELKSAVNVEVKRRSNGKEGS